MLKWAYVLWPGNPKEAAAESMASEKDGDIKRVNTKEWARSIRYEPVKLFNKVRESEADYLSAEVDLIWRASLYDFWR